MTELLLPGCPIRVSVSLCLLAARHGFSQLSTPFVALIRLGIRLTPFVVLLSPFYPNVLFTFPVQFSKNLLRDLVGLGRLELWWVWEDLNFRPHAYQACALTG